LAGWALEHLTESDIERARVVIRKINASRLASERLHLAAEFHTLIYQRANRPFFLEQVSRARSNLNRYWILAWRERSFPADTQAEHEEMLDLCAKKDRVGLMDLVERHILASADVVLAYLQALEATDHH
jgi:DNA-binding GntR family transcriptional regulator